MNDLKVILFKICVSNPSIILGIFAGILIQQKTSQLQLLLLEKDGTIITMSFLGTTRQVNWATTNSIPPQLSLTSSPRSVGLLNVSGIKLSAKTLFHTCFFTHHQVNPSHVTWLHEERPDVAMERTSSTRMKPTRIPFGAMGTRIFHRMMKLSYVQCNSCAHALLSSLITSLTPYFPDKICENTIKFYTCLTLLEKKKKKFILLFSEAICKWKFSIANTNWFLILKFEWYCGKIGAPAENCPRNVVLQVIHNAIVIALFCY